MSTEEINENQSNVVETPTEENALDLSEAVEAVESVTTVSPARNIELMKEVFGEEYRGLIQYLDTLDIEIPENYFDKEKDDKDVLPFFFCVKLAPSVVAKLGKARGTRIIEYLNLINRKSALYRDKEITLMVLTDLASILVKE